MRTIEVGRTQQFEMGQVLITDTLLAIFLRAEAAADEQFCNFVASAVIRHGFGDWGDVSDGDAEANEWGLQSGLRLLSAYRWDPEIAARHGITDEKLWVLTEASREYTTVLLPSDY